MGIYETRSRRRSKTHTRGLNVNREISVKRKAVRHALARQAIDMLKVGATTEQDTGLSLELNPGYSLKSPHMKLKELRTK